MITRKEKLLWLGYGIILVLLFLLSSTDLIIKEEKREIYPISVIVEDTSDINYVNFRKGMEQAAIERNADISFITLYEAGSASQQQELIAREQQAGGHPCGYGMDRTGAGAGRGTGYDGFCSDGAGYGRTDCAVL